MKTYNYSILNPTGNITMLVCDYVDKKIQADIAKKLFAYEKTVEQIGFISGYDDSNSLITLRMSGGEFCGNAAMSVGVYFAEKLKLSTKEFTVRFDDCNQTVSVSVERNTSGDYRGTVTMPEISDIRNIRYEIDGKSFNLPTVEFDSITHIICETALQKDFAENAIRKWCDDLGAKSLGIMFCDFNINKIVPLVFVKESDALYWEGSCASGTAAVGWYLSQKLGTDIDMTFSEPMGELRIKKQTKSPLYLYGKVNIVSQKAIEL